MVRVLLAVMVVVGLLGPASSVSAADCRFVLGFKALHDQIPDVVGDCKVNEHYNPANGDALQETIRGLLVWRKADNFTAFTDGYRTWVNGPYGVQMRLNTERFPWEADVAAPPSRAPASQTNRPTSAAPLTGLYRVNLTRKEKNLYKDTSGAYFFTRHCYEYVYGEEAIYDASRQRLRFEDETCDVARVITSYIESEIDGEFEGWTGRTLFPLLNGQIWRQVDGTYWYHYAYNPRVIIYSASSAWWMLVDDVDDPVMVQRVR